MTIFLTGGTGFIGSYVVSRLLRRSDERLTLLVRGKDHRAAEEKLWRALQNHMDGPEFFDALDRMDIALGDLTAPRLGFDDETYDRIVRNASSFLHIAASLNRKSAKACFNHNLRGSLAVIEMARDAKDHHGLRRFDHISTAAVAGKRHGEVLTEDETVDWDRSDYDPYARTKKFVEHMVDELLPDVTRVVYRPVSVFGDARHPRTTAFDMAKMLGILAGLPVLPMSGDVRLDIANVDWVARVITKVFLTPEPKYDAYSLSAGEASNTARDITDVVTKAIGRPPVRFVPALDQGFQTLVNLVDQIPARNEITGLAAVLKVFWPYMIYDTVFDNSRAVEAVGGEAPAPFVDYCVPLYHWVRDHDYEYPYKPFPDRPVRVHVPTEIQA
jgi:long-chain acyl-CoA synthetase